MFTIKSSLHRAAIICAPIQSLKVRSSRLHAIATGLRSSMPCGKAGSSQARNEYLRGYEAGETMGYERGYVAGFKDGQEARRVEIS